MPIGTLVWLHRKDAVVEPVYRLPGEKFDNSYCFNSNGGVTYKLNDGEYFSPCAPPDEIETLPNGAMQSKLDARFDLLPALAIENLAQGLAFGAKKYAPNNWRLIPAESHLNHALRHLVKYLQSDTAEDHLGHAFCRVGMALELTLCPVPSAALTPTSTPKSATATGPE